MLPEDVLLVAEGDGSVSITVEVADTTRTRREGLSGRAALLPDAGMLFVYERDVEFAFHMERTTIPLSLAFLDEDGVVLEILDMEPCAQAPCPRYEPSAPYRDALEVNQGAFARWGIGPGDRLIREQR